VAFLERFLKLTAFEAKKFVLKTVDPSRFKVAIFISSWSPKNDLRLGICCFSEKQIRERKSKHEEKPILNAKIGLLVTLIVTAVIGVYGIELGIRVSTGSGRPEYLFVVLIITVLLLLADMLFYRRYKRDKQKNWF